MVTVVLVWYLVGFGSAVSLTACDWYHGADFHFDEIRPLLLFSFLGGVLAIFAIVYIIMEYVSNKPLNTKQRRIMIHGRVQK